MDWAVQLLRLTAMPIAMAIFLLAAQTAGGLTVRDETGVHVALK